jgi:hypothetical protein
MKFDVIDSHDGHIIADGVSLTEAEQWAAQSERAIIRPSRSLSHA